MDSNDTLIVIPARGGSKGISGKNIKLLGGKPLIHYAIDVARLLSPDDNICVTTDSEEIINVVNKYGLHVPFKRPESLATDDAGMYEVLLHCLDHYKAVGRTFTKLVLLQPTSPFRTSNQVSRAIAEFSDNIDMVVSVSECKMNPYYNLFEERNGFLTKSKPKNFARRQDCPAVYAYNGAIYVINVNSLYAGPLYSFKKIKKFVMDRISSLDLDDTFDWFIAESVIGNFKVAEK